MLTMKKYFILLLCLLGCAHPKEPILTKPLILVSVEPYVAMVEAIAGSEVTARCVLPSYVDPHNWEPKHRDLAQYDDAKIWFTIGEGFESPLLKKLTSINSQLKAISLSASITKLPTCDHHSNCGFDTHFWLDPILDIEQAKIIYETLAKLIPEKASLFRTNYIHLKDQLTTLDKAITDSLRPYQGQIFVTSHGAFTYFCKRYHIRQFVIEPHEGKEPKPQDLTHLIDDLKKERSLVLGICTQPQHSNKASKILAKALDLPIFSIDPYKQNYIETMVLLETHITSAHAKTTDSN